jgi:hypothetical protein
MATAAKTRLVDADAAGRRSYRVTEVTGEQLRSVPGKFALRLYGRGADALMRQGEPDFIASRVQAHCLGQYWLNAGERFPS